jgi:hypothetical protein
MVLYSLTRLLEYAFVKGTLSRYFLLWKNRHREAEYVDRSLNCTNSHSYLCCAAGVSSFLLPYWALHGFPYVVVPNFSSRVRFLRNDFSGLFPKLVSEAFLRKAKLTLKDALLLQDVSYGRKSVGISARFLFLIFCSVSALNLIGCALVERTQPQPHSQEF